MSDDLGSNPLKPVASFFGVMIVLAFCGLVVIAFDFLPDFDESNSYSFHMSDDEPPELEIIEPEKKLLSINVTEYPNKLEHSCKQFVAKLKLTNDGVESISYEDIYDISGDYTLYFSINSKPLKNEKFGVGEDGSWTGQMIGIEKFDTLQPGESTEATFYGGGIVIQKTFADGREAYILHHNNIFTPGEYKDGQIGANELQFFWASNLDEDGYYTINPRILAESEVMNVELFSDECDKDDIHKTEPIGNF